MKYLNSICGNHKFYFNGVVIVAWTVVGNETICVTLDNFEGEWLRFTGDFKAMYEQGVEGLQKFLESKTKKLTAWLPKSIEAAEKKRAEVKAAREAENAKKQAKIDKDRKTPLYRFVSIKKKNHVISIATQPYQVGVYIAISDSKISQLIQYGKNNHRTANSNIDKIIKKFESEGYEVVKSKEKIDYSKI
jgi:hypothetical protein